MTDLGTEMARIATTAAIAYLKTNSLKADPGALSECLRAHVKIAMDGALRDAKAAIDANMPDVATRTFSASMALAGIEAAKEAGFPLNFTV